MTISPRQLSLIEDFLADRLGDDRRSEFERLLNEHDLFAQELTRRTADVDLWNDARTFLSSHDDVMDDESSGISPDATRIDFLTASDDPAMLGRFAGYEISGVIGSGGMGIVLKGFDRALNRYAAIKVLAPHYASSAAARQRFAREAQAAAAVVHDNVIAIHGVDEFQNLPYLVMPYVKGESLQKRIEQNGQLSVQEVLRVGLQTARGLAAAHDQGLVHRDIKPGNILLPAGLERVIITDFGLARAADDASLTRSGVIAGTPQYMSPEQAAGEPIDHRSDLFSLGSVMYAMCCGHPPFRAETPYGILRRITDHEARPIREINASIPAWLEEVIARLLKKSPDKRPATAAEVASLLEDCLAHVQQPNKVALPESLAKASRSRFVPITVAVASVVLMSWGIASLWSGNNQREATDDKVAQSSHHSPSDEARSESVHQPKEHRPDLPRPGDLDYTPNDTNQAAPEPDELRWDISDEFSELDQSLQDLRNELQDESDDERK